MAKSKKEAMADPADTAREFIERSTSASKTFTAAMSAATIAGLRTAFDLQNGFIAAGRSVADAAVAANEKLADQSVHALKTVQAETTKLVEAGTKVTADLIEAKV